MKIKQFVGSIVLDKNANEVGKIDNVDFNTETGKLDTISISLQRNIFSQKEVEIDFEDIATIGKYVILNKEIEVDVEEDEEEDEETTTVEIEDEEE